MRKRIWNDVYESGIEYGLESDKKLMIVEYMMSCSDLLNWNRNEWKKGIELIRTIDECGWIEEGLLNNIERRREWGWCDGFRGWSVNGSNIRIW